MGNRFLEKNLLAVGLKPNLKKVEILEMWPAPTYLTELRSFLGLWQYFSKVQFQINAFNAICHNFEISTRKCAVQIGLLVAPQKGFSAEFWLVVYQFWSGYAFVSKEWRVTRKTVEKGFRSDGNVESPI